MNLLNTEDIERSKGARAEAKKYTKEGIWGMKPIKRNGRFKLLEHLLT